MAILDVEEDIFDLSEKSLTDLFFELNSKTDRQFIQEKTHVRFLQDYLGEYGLDARFAVIERNYINRDYLIDYSTYYSTCFADYSKKGCRIHFFSINIRLAEFKERFINLIIEGNEYSDSNKKFWTEYYLGFIFVKPIPNLFIGFSLLKHYNFSEAKNCFNENRVFWGVKNYKNHIFGTEVTIPSLAFQEQDQNVAACATIAIWSMLQIAAEDYYVVLQSPSEITRNSGLVSTKGNRLIPNKGLSILQMAQAVTQNNLVTEVRERTDYEGEASFNLYIKKLIHAYSNLGIPLILLINLSPSDRENDEGEDETNREIDIDGHAVAVSGYSMRPLADVLRRNRLLKVTSQIFNDKNIIWKADLIEKIYSHDDQWGPFSKMTFSGKHKIRSSWQLVLDHKAIPYTEGLIVPVYPKVRIPYDDIEAKVIRLNDFFNDHFQNKFVGQIVWDIQIYYSERFKRLIRNSELLDHTDPSDRNLQFKFLTKALPKYVWVATLQSEEQNILHFIFDATGLSGSNIILSIFGFFPDLTAKFKKTLRWYRKIKDTEFTFIFDHDVNSYLEAIID